MRLPLSFQLLVRKWEGGETKAHRRGSTAYARTHAHTHRIGLVGRSWTKFRLGRCFYSRSSSTHRCVCVRGPWVSSRIWSVCGCSMLSRTHVKY